MGRLTKPWICSWSHDSGHMRKGSVTLTPPLRLCDVTPSSDVTPAGRSVSRLLLLGSLRCWAAPAGKKKQRLIRETTSESCSHQLSLCPCKHGSLLSQDWSLLCVGLCVPLSLLEKLILALVSSLAVAACFSLNDHLVLFPFALFSFFPSLSLHPGLSFSLVSLLSFALSRSRSLALSISLVSLSLLLSLLSLPSPIGHTLCPRLTSRIYPTGLQYSRLPATSRTHVKLSPDVTQRQPAGQPVRRQRISAGGAAIGRENGPRVEFIGH